jgi:hypothetical protein
MAHIKCAVSQIRQICIKGLKYNFMNKLEKIFIILFLIFFVNCIIFAWSDPKGEMPSGSIVPINTGPEAQTKSGSLTVGELTVQGKANICQIVAFNDSGTQAKCPPGYYVTEMVASKANGDMLCCKVNNPLK